MELIFLMHLSAQWAATVVLSLLTVDIEETVIVLTVTKVKYRFKNFFFPQSSPHLYAQ